MKRQYCIDSKGSEIEDEQNYLRQRLEAIGKSSEDEVLGIEKVCSMEWDSFSTEKKDEIIRKLEEKSIEDN